MLRFGTVCVAVLGVWCAAARVQAKPTSTPIPPPEPGYALRTEIPYYEGASDAYILEQCVLDLYYPSDVEGFATVVWFHGGGLSTGERHVPALLRERGFAVAAVSYRLHPRVTSPAYVQDAAAAVAWTLDTIEEFGGSRELVFVSGHSAGGYLTSMVGLDRRWLGEHGHDPDELAGLIPISGHTITHATPRKEQGIGELQPIVDDMAPLFHVRDDAPPLLLVVGDRELELWGRYEENAYMERMMELVGHEQTELHEVDGFNHGSMLDPALYLTVEFVDRLSREARDETE